MIIIDENGDKKYRYYKKKRGPHKKTGPKKKKPAPKKRGRKPIPKPTFNFKIVRCERCIQKNTIGEYETIIEANAAKEELLERNKSVILPKLFTNNTNIKDKSAMCEYLILERVNDGDNTPTKLSNEFGKLVDHKSTNSRWKIYDKFECLVEETFWVYGYNCRNDRKNCLWIEENAFRNELENDRYLFIRVVLYGNKIIVKLDNYDFHLVICKNPSDAIRLYNHLRETFKKEKRVLFTGKIGEHKKNAYQIIEMIRKKTGWCLSKIACTSTSYYK